MRKRYRADIWVKLEIQVFLMRLILSGLLATVLSVSFCFCLQAQNGSKTNSKGKTDSASTNKTDYSGLPQLSQQLTDLHDTMKHLKHAATNLMGEMNRSEMKILEYDDYINQYVDDKPVEYNEQLYPYGFQNIGNTSTIETPMQPRKKWVDYYVGQLGSLIGIARTEVQTVLENQAVSAASSDLTARMKTNMSALLDHFAKVTKLAGADTYDKDAIQAESAAIRDEGGDIDLCSRKLYRAAKEKK